MNACDLWIVGKNLSPVRCHSECRQPRPVDRAHPAKGQERGRRHPALFRIARQYPHQHRNSNPPPRFLQWVEPSRLLPANVGTVALVPPAVLDGTQTAERRGARTAWSGQWHASAGSGWWLRPHTSGCVTGSATVALRCDFRTTHTHAPKTPRRHVTRPPHRDGRTRPTAGRTPRHHCLRLRSPPRLARPGSRSADR